MKPTPHLGRATCLRFGVVRALAASAAGLNRAPVLSTQVELETEPIVMMGDEAVLESWGIFRLDSATRNPPKHLLQELNAAGCRYDDDLRSWTVDEELEANPDGSFTRSWSGVSRGSGPELFVPAPDVQRLIDRSFHEATSPDALSVAATWHFDRLRQKVRDINSRIDAEYRSQVAAAVERGSATWADARVEVPDNLPDIDSIFNRQFRRRAERVRRKAERRQHNSASCNIAEQPELEEPTLPSIADPVQPIAFAAERVEIDEWCEFNLRCRTPKAVAAGSDVLILPLEDERAKSLDFLVAPALCRVDESGYVVIRCLNPHRRKITVSLLSQVARFVVDPRISGADLEFTTDEIIERINLPTDLSPEELQYVRAMISQRRRLFATTLGWAHGYKQKIDTPLIDSGAVPPPAFPMRNRPPGEWAILKEFVDKQLAQRLIEPCISPYNAVPMCVKKPDGTYRVVIDLRALNALTKRDVYPLPNIQANLNKLGKAHWFTAVDLLMGFHQCELEEEAKIKTAFGTPWGQMCYTRMPMGLTSSPSAFMRLVDAALRGLPSEVVTPYVDDILISTGGTFKEHIDTVSAVFEKLVAAGFTVKCEKVHIGMRECSYLGFLVGAYGTRPEAKKTKPIFDMTYERLRSDPSAPGRFAGMIGFYRKFLDHASSMLASFDDLKSKEGQAMHDDIVDSLRFRAAFESLKHALSQATALARPDFNKPFYIDVDASTVNGIGAALSQRMDETDPTTHYPVSFYSRRFDSTERGYPVRDQECMGLTEAVTEWRPYVLGSRTIVRTDHKSLKWLMTCQHPDGSRVANWALNIQEYGVEIEYIPGKEHVVADCLSRAVAEAVGIHSESFVEEGPFTDTPGGPAIKVSTRNGSRQPAKLMKLGVCDFQRRPIPGVRIETNIIDSGSGAEIMGLADFHWLNRVAPTCIRRRDAPLASSLERILGVGQGQSGVYCHAELMLSFGGKAIYCEDIAVLVHHKGVLLGNDTLDSSRAVISYNGNCEGHVRLRDSSLRWCSDAVPFSVARNSSAPCFAVGAIETFTPHLGHLPSHDPLTNLIQHLVLASSAEPLGTESLSAAPQDLVSILAITPSLHILAERQSGVVSLPTVQVTSNLKNGLACRKRLASHWRDCFGPSSEISLRLLDGLLSSITSPTKLSSSCMRYMVVVVDDVQSLSSIQHMLPGHETVVLDRNSWMDVDDNDNREFIDTFLRSLHRNHPVHRLHHTRSWRIDHLRPVFRRLRTLRGGENKGGKIKHKLQQSTSRHHAAIAAFYSPTSSACTAEAAAIDPMQLQLEGRAPRLSDKPNGPALCKSRSEIVEACKRLYSRLKANPSQVLAVDLEGELGGPRSYISKIQVAVDGDDHGPALVYVIDSHYNPPAIAIDAPMSLKSILEDDTIVKVIHHCRGDTGALFYQYGIATRNVFDTALADCLLQHRHFNSSRNLETVLTESLGHQAVHLNFKGKLIHTPRMFEEEPLPLHLFVYAYEDVVFLGALYATLKDRLQGCGKGELHHSLTQCRIPPRALPQGHPGFQPAERIAVAVLDHQHVVCVQSKADAVYTLPIADIGKDTTRTHIGLKKRASEIWSATMGKPPKHVAAAVNAKLRSPTRLSAENGRDVLLYETRLDNCVLRLNSMEMSFSTRSIANEADIVLRRRDSIALITNDCDSELHASFQFIDPAFGEVQRHNAIKLVPESSEPMPTATPLIRLSIRPTSGSSVSTSLAFTDCLSANSVTSEPAATVCIVTGRTISDRRAALILHDSSSAFAISTNLKGARVAWPSTPVMVGEDPAEAAIRAFDIFAGPSLRKGSDSAQPSRWALSPLVGTTINADIMRGMKQLNTDSTECGNTIYFAVKFSGVQTQDTSVRVKFNVAASGVEVELITDPGCKFPTLLDCSSAIHASRRECNGFRLVNTLKSRHKSAGLLDIRPSGNDTNSGSLHPTTPHDGPSKPEPLGISDLSSYDAAALKTLQSDPEPQSPTSATVFALLSTVALAFHESEPDTSELSAVRASPPHEGDGGANDATDFLPSVGEDLEFDKLFLAYVTIAAGSADLPPTPPSPGDCPDCSEPDSDDADVRNTVYVECRHGFVVVEGEHWDSEITPVCHRRGCARRALRWWQRNRDFIRQSDAAAEGAEAQEPVISGSGGSRVASTAGQHNAFCAHAEGSHRNVRFVNAGARASDLGADSIGKAPQAGDSPPSFRDILSEQRVHPATSGLVHFLLTNDVLEDCGHDRSELESLAKRHSLDDNGVLVYNSGAALEPNRIVLPPRFHVWCCRQFHDRQGHFGVARTLDHISRRYTWGSEAQMKRDVQQYINCCRVCARTKMGRHPMGEGIIGDHGNHPMDILDTDVYKVGYKSSTGEDTIISFADHFSKAVFARARVGDPTSEQFAETLIDTIISHYGVPRAIRSDHASVLISHAIRHLYQIYGIKMADGKPYMHRSIGLVERWHSTLKHLLLSVRLSTGSDDWHKFLPLLQLAFNSAVASATGYSPFFLNHLRHPVLPIDNISTTRSHLKVEDMPDWVSQSLDQLQVSFDAVNQRLKVRALKAKKIWDLKHDVVTSFSPGDLVLVVKGSVIDGNHPKGEEPMHGPYTVRRRLARDNYQLADLRNNRLHDEFPISRLRPYPSRRLRSEDSELYPVQAIVGHRIRKVPINAKGSLAPMAGQSLVEYRIRWSGFSKSYDSFRSAQFLSDAFDLVSAYREMRRQKGLSPLPDEDPSPELEDHAIGQPEVDPDAKRKPRFRADPSSMREPSVTLPDRLAGRSDPQSSGDHVGTSSLNDIFPVGTRVQVRYSDGWWTGTVCETYVSKATSKRPSERRLVIQYDSKEYKDELWEHGLRGTLVRCLAQGESPSPQIAPPLAPIVLPVPPSSLEPVRCDAGLVTNARQQGGRWEYLVTSTGRKGVQRERFLPASAFTSTELESFSCFRQPAPASSTIESHSDDRGVSEIAGSHDAHPPGIFSRVIDRDDPVLPLAATGLGRRSSACEEADAVSGRSGNSRRARRPRIGHPQRTPVESEPRSESEPRPFYIDVDASTVNRRPRIGHPQRTPVESEPRSESEPTVIGIGAILQLQRDIPGSADSVATRVNDANVTHRNSDQLSRFAYVFAPQPSAAAYLSCLNLVVPAVRTLDGRLFNTLHTLHLPEIEGIPYRTVVATRSRNPISSVGTAEVAVIEPMQPQMEGRPRRLSDSARNLIIQHTAEMEARGLIHRSVSSGDSFDSLDDIPRNSSRFLRLAAVMPTFESAARQLVADFGARIAAAQALDPTTRTLIEWIQSGRRRHPSFQEHVLERREVPVEYTVNSSSAVQIPSYSGCGVTFILSRDQRPSSSSEAVYVSQPTDDPIQFYRIPAEHAADASDPQTYELVQNIDLVTICSVVTHCQQGGYVPGRLINCTDDTILVPLVTATIRVNKAVGSLYKPPWVRQCELVGNLLCFRETGRPPNIWGGLAPEPSRELSATDRLLPVVPVCCRAHEIRRFHDIASRRRVAGVWNDFRLSVWWPTISKDIWSHVRMCHECTFTTNRYEPLGEILVLPDSLPRRGPTLHMGLSFNDLFRACDVELHSAHNLVTQDQYGYCLGCRRPFLSVEIGWPMTCPGCNATNFMIGCAALPQDYIERNVILSWCHEYFMAYGAKLESPFKHRRRWLRAGVFVTCYLRLMRCYAAILERRLAPGGAGYLDALNEFDDLLLGFPARPSSPSHCDIPDATLLPSASDLRAEDPVERGRSITQASSLCDSASQLDSSVPASVDSLVSAGVVFSPPSTPSPILFLRLRGGGPSGAGSPSTTVPGRGEEEMCAQSASAAGSSSGGLTPALAGADQGTSPSSLLNESPLAFDELFELQQIFRQISMAPRASAGSRSDSPDDQATVVTDFSEPLLVTTSGAGGLGQAFNHSAGSPSVVTNMREALDELRGVLGASESTPECQPCDSDHEDSYGEGHAVIVPMEGSPGCLMLHSLLFSNPIEVERIRLEQSQDPATQSITHWLLSGVRDTAFNGHVLQGQPVVERFDLRNCRRAVIQPFGSAELVFKLPPNVHHFGNACIESSAVRPRAVDDRGVPVPPGRVIITHQFVRVSVDGVLFGEVVNYNPCAVTLEVASVSARCEISCENGGPLQEPEWLHQCSIYEGILCYSFRTPCLRGSVGQPVVRTTPIIPVSSRARWVRRYHDYASGSAIQADAVHRIKLQVWWPTIEADIIQHWRHCHECVFRTNCASEASLIHVPPGPHVATPPVEGGVTTFGRPRPNIFTQDPAPRVALRIDMWPVELHRACYSALEDGYSSARIDGYVYCIFCQVPIENSAADWGLSVINQDANTWRFQGECPECYSTTLIACDFLPHDYVERRVVLKRCHDDLFSYSLGGSLCSVFARRRWLRAGLIIVFQNRLMAHYMQVIERSLSPGGSSYLLARADFHFLSCPTDQVLLPGSRPPSPPPAPPDQLEPGSSSSGPVFAACHQGNSRFTYAVSVAGRLRWLDASAFSPAEIESFSRLRDTALSISSASAFSIPLESVCIPFLSNAVLSQTGSRRNPYRLDVHSISKLSEAQRMREPLTIRSAMSGRQDAISSEWTAFIASDSLQYTTNEGIRTDRGDGSSPHCRGPCTLIYTWDNPIRIETGLGDQPELNPVQRWMQHSSPDSNAMLLARLDDQLSEIAARSALPGTPLLSPSFITGRVNVGDPGQVHWDDYDSFALVVLGCKTFFIAPPSAFSSASSTRRGHSHVLPGLSPFDAPPESSPWRRVVLYSGDVLYLPRGWWHCVLSEPHSVMTNIWSSGVQR